MSRRPVRKISGLLLCFVFAITSLSAFAAGEAEDDLLFFCNYDVLLTVDDSVGQINSRARVRDGHVVPIEFQDHKIEILIASGGETGVEFAITLYQKFEQQWYEVSPLPLRFGGELGIPVQYQWSDGYLSLDVAISVSSRQ